MPKGKREPKPTKKLPTRKVACPFCGHEADDPDWMEPAELKAIAHMIGRRLGWEGALPRKQLAYLISVSPRSVTEYLAGRVAIPRLAAVRLRELRHMPASEMGVPRSWEDRRQKEARRRLAGLRRRVRRKAAEPTPSNSP